MWKKFSYSESGGFVLERSEKVKTDPRASGKSSCDHKPLSEKHDSPSNKRAATQTGNSEPSSHSSHGDKK